MDSPRRGGRSEQKLRAIIVGGSIAGLSCAHALLKSGVCRVMVLEKARALTGSSHGAGLGVDAAACEALEDWGLRDKLFLKSKPLDREEVSILNHPQSWRLFLFHRAVRHTSVWNSWGQEHFFLEGFSRSFSTNISAQSVVLCLSLPRDGSGSELTVSGNWLLSMVGMFW